MKRLMGYFWQGLLYIAPLGVTLYIVYMIFEFVDGLLQDLLQQIGLRIPGLGFLIIFLFLIFIGMVGQSIIARPFTHLFSRIINRIPLLKFTYSAFKDLFTAFVGKERKFNKPVIVLINPVSNLEKLGFLTEKDLSKLNEKDKVAVYFPHSYNFSGELFIVPAEQVRPIDMNPTDVMKFIVSGGVSGWETEQKEVH